MTDDKLTPEEVKLATSLCPCFPAHETLCQFCGVTAAALHSHAAEAVRRKDEEWQEAMQLPIEMEVRARERAEKELGEERALHQATLSLLRERDAQVSAQAYEVERQKRLNLEIISQSSENAEHNFYLRERFKALHAAGLPEDVVEPERITAWFAALREQLTDAMAHACHCLDCREHRLRCGEVEALRKRVEELEAEL